MAPRSGRTRRIPVYAIVLIVAAVGLAAYWNGLTAPFIWDDDPAIVSNLTIRNVLPLSESLSPPLETPAAGRPLVNLSLAMNYAAGNLDETGYHAWNLAVLIASALLLFGIVRLTLAGVDRRLPGDALALAASLIWVAHPLLSETVEYVTQRTESMMGFFFLLTLYAAIRGRESGGWLAASVVSCVAGMATKESMAVAPLAVMLYDRVFVFDSWRDAARERGWFYGALAATWVELGLLMWRWPRSTVGAASVSSWTYLVNQAAMIARYVGLAVWPRALVIDYGLPRAIGVADVLPQALLVLALLAGTAVALVRWPAIGFLGAMFFLTLAPTSSVVPIASEVGAERRMYLPLAALSVLAVMLAWALVERLRAKWPPYARALTIAAVCAAAAAVAALAVRTSYRNRDYATPLALWESAVATRPHGRARFALATEYVTAGRHEEAIAQLREAVPDYPDARAGLGAELFLLGQRAEAIDVLDLFIGANPSHPNRIPARILTGQALLAQGRIDEGASQFSAVLAADPSSVAANQGMATVARIRAARFLEQGNIAQASAQAREALRLNAGDADAHNVLGVTLAQQGQVDEAVREFQVALRINPQHTQAARNLERATALAREHAK
jgi:tetratricopeptide (TPR) repeat protein